eukprot:scaffold19795_cov19-Tisochrysis_lutea.AAC.4
MKQGQDLAEAEGAWPPITVSLEEARRSATNSPLRGRSALDVQGAMASLHALTCMHMLAKNET